MRKIKNLIAVVLVLACVLSLAACGKSVDLWKDATYVEDTTLGEGATSISVTVTAQEKSVVFTVNTDKTILSEALLEHELISGDVGEFGIYIKYVNGIRADYDIDMAYWGLKVNGEFAMTGADSVQVENGGNYELVYTK